MDTFGPMSTTAPSSVTNATLAASISPGAIAIPLLFHLLPANAATVLPLLSAIVIFALKPIFENAISFTLPEDVKVY